MRRICSEFARWAATFLPFPLEGEVGEGGRRPSGRPKESSTRTPLPSLPLKGEGTSCVVGVILSLFILASPALAQTKLTLAFIPQENPEKLIGDVAAITRYLSAETGFEVRGHVTQDHAAAVEALAAGHADAAFMGALPAVMAGAQTGAEIVLAEVYRGKPWYSGAIFVKRGSGIRTLAELRGKTIAFADPISESGYLYPYELFVEAKLVGRDDDPQKFFRRVYFAGGYQQAIQAAANGLVEAAGVSIYAPLLLPVDKQTEVVAIAETPPIPSHCIVVRKGLSPEARERFVAAMLKLNEPSRRHLLKHVYAPDGYVRPDLAHYAKVADLARLYGLIGK
jgi:phosphonate transport system substrate-binding protein